MQPSPNSLTSSPHLPNFRFFMPSFMVVAPPSPFDTEAPLGMPETAELPFYVRRIWELARCGCICETEEAGASKGIERTQE
jgi:hypothetical protein